MIQYKKILMTLALLLTAVTGAWAEEKMVTINSSTMSSGAVTATGFYTLDNFLFVSNKTATITTSEGVITKLVIKKYDGSFGDAFTEANVGVTPGTITYGSDEITVTDINAESVTLSRKGNNNWSTSSVDVYYGEPTEWPLTPDATRKIWTLDKMPAGNVELQVEYYPGMLVKPTSLVGGTLSIEGLTDTAMPEGFEKDAEGNIYVAKDTKFTVKAVPAEGYHLVGWSDDATNKELERVFTMTDDDFTVTATFSDAYDIAFNAANANTIEAGKATVKIGDAAATVSEGKIQGVKAGQTVTLNAATGYKFRTVEAKKGIVKLLSITVGAVTIYYAEGENWTDAINRAENKDSGLFIREGNRVHHPDYGQLVDSNTQPVLPDAKINANESYKFVK